VSTGVNRCRQVSTAINHDRIKLCLQVRHMGLDLHIHAHKNTHTSCMWEKKRLSRALSSGSLKMMKGPSNSALGVYSNSSMWLPTT